MSGTKQFPQPPSPAGDWVFGNLRELRKDPLGFFARCAEVDSGIVRVRILNRSGYLLNDPALIEEALVTRSGEFIKTAGREPSGTSDRLFGEDLLAGDGDFWMRERNQVQPAFSQKRLTEYARVMVDLTREETLSWKDGEERDIYEDMGRLTLKIVAKTLFDTTVTDVEPVKMALDVVMEEITKSIFNPFWRASALWGDTKTKFKNAVHTLDSFMDDIVKEHLAGKTGGDDLMSALLASRSANREALTDRQWRYEIMTLFIAGYETTALALSWTFYLLSQNPQVLEKLEAEIGDVLGGRLPEYEDYGQLRFSGFVLREALRLYPPVWMLGGRKTLAECEIGGYTVPAGSIVVICPWASHRNARYFAKPETFDPSRWDKLTDSNFPKFAYFPFGGGIRHCIGYSYALVESLLIMVTMAQHVRLELKPGFRPIPKPMITLRPENGLLMRVRKRI